MKKVHIIIILVAIVIFVSVILATILINTNEFTPVSSLNHTGETKYETNITISGDFFTKGVLNPDITRAGDQLNYTIPNLNIGEEYVYEFKSYSHPSSDSYGDIMPFLISILTEDKYKINSNLFVENLDKQNGTKTYLLKETDIFTYGGSVFHSNYSISKEGIILTSETKINLDSTLNITQIERNAELNALREKAYTPVLYSPWMSVIDENFSWKQTLNFRLTFAPSLGTLEIIHYPMRDSTYKYGTKGIKLNQKIITQYEVQGIETINGRRCFKVIASEDSKIDYSPSDEEQYSTWMQDESRTGILWIDYEKRILVKKILIDDIDGGDIINLVEVKHR